ncbi:hypothetical protein [Francisella philomiragia]|uniref:hypothetical protein n=1 Tax=Francisella philomiragia TaxID=28110 RepID=UPI0001AF7788|nr:hypothetical protein [Francisella philomiragia]AJI54718.1 hypothetical protein LA56_1268 [Francisella philomiragia]AJI75695.1 hypothetical protein BZ13_1122 [Francisella philomiragia subsp. philomiragia ATCC 25015]EET20675.1 conserved hypothetical protein [Francisella philomiragia subsp. philomiragia ATCC 25015]MBK2238437.1 hypothetical protein [Francisella philomiragia]MBK2253362.1 hypothetical protein [Francisella philomiragia]
MKKLIFTSIAIMTLASTGYSSVLKGSDYISTDVGTTYNFERVDADDKDNFLVQTTIKNCSDDKTSCQYFSEIKEPSGKEVSQSKYVYSYITKNNGDVYIQYPNSDKETLLLPANIEFNKIRKENITIGNSKFSNTYEFKKEIPKLTINGKDYENCIELEANSTVKYKGQVEKTQSIETYCKKIGLVKDTLKETFNSEKPIVYKNILMSITK